MLESALSARSHLTQTPDTVEQTVDVRPELRTALLPLGELGRIRQYLGEVGSLAETLNDGARLARTSIFQL